MRPGRNDPCPCGSGRKYKHCCLSRAQPATGITPADRDEVFEALLRFTRRPEFDEVVEDAALMWVGGEPDDDPGDALEDIVAHDTARETFFDWLFFDLLLDDQRTVADLFLERHHYSLNPRALDYLRLMMSTHLRAWQVRHVEPGVGMTLRDLLTNDEVVIAERRATTQVVVWDVLVARVVSHADGSRQLEGSVMLLPALSAPAIVKALKAEHRRARRVDPDIRDDAFFKMTAPLFYIMWDELVAGALPPELQTVEGDALSFSELIFDVPKAGDALAALLVQPDFEPGELGQAVWLEPGDDGPRLLADVSCAKGTLSLRALSRERAGRARARVEEVVGALRLRSEHHTAPDLDEGPAVARHTTPAGAIDIDDVPELAVWRDQQDRAWLDLDIPALDGKTPRQAAKSRRMKPRLVQLLIDIENREARMAAPKPARDLTWMWKELGLERP